MKKIALLALNNFWKKAWETKWSRYYILSLPFFLLTFIAILYSPYRIGVDIQRVAGRPSCLPSLVYLLDYTNPRAPKHGDYAIFSFPETGFKVGLKAGAKTVKIVHALPGDLVEVKGTELTVRQLFTDRLWLAKSIPGKQPGDFDSSYSVPEGKFFAYGTEKESLDSRYFGPVDQRSIVGYARPLF